MSIDQMMVGGGGMWISKEIHINGFKIPLLNRLKIRFFRLWHAARASVSVETTFKGTSIRNRNRCEPFVVKLMIFSSLFSIATMV